MRWQSEHGGRIRVRNVKESVSPETVSHYLSKYSRRESGQPDFVVIDHIGLMKSADPAKGEANWSELKKISNSLKRVATTEEVPILIAAQTNRAAATGGARLENLAGSDAIGQDSDLVVFVERASPESKVALMKIEKQREGVNCTWHTMFDPGNADFRDISPNDAITQLKKEEITRKQATQGMYSTPV